MTAQQSGRRATGSRARKGGADAARSGGRTAAPPLLVALVCPRDRTRTLVRSAFPRRRVRVATLRSTVDLVRLLRTELVDGVLVDVGTSGEESWLAAERARDFPAVPFFAALPLRAVDGAAASRCASLEMADMLVDGADDAAVRELLTPSFYTNRFAQALADPPSRLRLSSSLQRDAWTLVVERGGRPIRTEEIAAALGLTREHLSRRFRADGGGGPTLKRTIDLVRVISASELLKSPGHDVGSVSSVLDFASSSHLSTTARRVAGVSSSSLVRLRAVDLVGRFGDGDWLVGHPQKE